MGHGLKYALGPAQNIRKRKARLFVREAQERHNGRQLIRQYGPNIALLPYMLQAVDCRRRDLTALPDLTEYIR